MLTPRRRSPRTTLRRGCIRRFDMKSDCVMYRVKGAERRCGLLRDVLCKDGRECKFYVRREDKICRMDCGHLFISKDRYEAAVLTRVICCSPRFLGTDAHRNVKPGESVCYGDTIPASPMKSRPSKSKAGDRRKDSKL